MKATEIEVSKQLPLMCHVQMMVFMVPFDKTISQQCITMVTWEFLLQVQMKSSSGALEMLSEHLLCVPALEPMTHESTSEKKERLSWACFWHAWRGQELLSMHYVNKENLQKSIYREIRSRKLSKMPPFLKERHCQLGCNFSSYLKKASGEGLRSRQPPKAGGVCG